MKKGLKRTGIVLLILIVLCGITLAFALPGLKETTALEIEAVDLTQIPDGTYTGSYNCFRWSNTVKVTEYVKNISGSTCKIFCEDL